MTPPAIEPGAPDPALADPMLRVLREQHPESEGLNGPRKNLAQADPALLGDAVQGAADAFLTTWEQRVLACATWRQATPTPWRTPVRAVGP